MAHGMVCAAASHRLMVVLAYSVSFTSHRLMVVLAYSVSFTSHRLMVVLAYSVSFASHRLYWLRLMVWCVLLPVIPSWLMVLLEPLGGVAGHR